MSRFPDSPDSPSKTAHFNSLRPRVCSDYFSLEDILVFWRSGAYKKYPRSYGADHRVCGDHCPTSGHSGPRTPVNHLLRKRLPLIRASLCTHPPYFVGTPPPVGGLPPRWTGPPLRSVALSAAGGVTTDPPLGRCPCREPLKRSLSPSREPPRALRNRRFSL